MNVYSGEVEVVTYQRPAVREAAVFGIPDPQSRGPVEACIECRHCNGGRSRTSRWP